MPHHPWYTADGIAQVVAETIDTTYGQTERWLVEGLNLLGEAADHNRLAEAITQPPRSVGEHRPGSDPLVVVRYDTLIAASMRYRLRLLREAGRTDLPSPDWTLPEPLTQLWFPNPLPHRAAAAMASAPLELFRAGIMIPASALR